MRHKALCDSTVRFIHWEHTSVRSINKMQPPVRRSRCEVADSLRQHLRERPLKTAPPATHLFLTLPHPTVCTKKLPALH